MIMKDGKIQKGNDAVVERRDSKDISAKDKGRHLNFHDWILTREIRMLDQAYDEQIYILSNDILNIAHISDPDMRDEAYKNLCETRDSIRATYIRRRNELKSQFSENMTPQKGRYPWGPKKQTIEEAANGIRHGGICYVDTDEIKLLAKDSLNGRFGCLDESAEFKDDPIVEACMDENNMSKKPDTEFIFNDHSDLKNAPGVTMNDLIDILNEQEEP